MAVTGTQTVRDIITDALLDLEVGSIGLDADDTLAAHAVRALNRLMKSWQLNDDAPAFMKASQSLHLTTAASYTLNPERPVRILSARFKRGGQEIPMIRLTRDEYDNLPVKNTTGTPTQFYYDRQKEDALFYVWPVLASASGETVEITYEREFEDVDINDTIDLPGEWWDVAVLQLASRLVHSYGSEAAKQSIPMRAEMAMNKALGASVDGESVYFSA
ncbi:MAG: hypothetical protein VW713_08395 [Alphaproteobacteria bacterium]